MYRGHLSITCEANPENRERVGILEDPFHFNLVGSNNITVPVAAFYMCEGICFRVCLRVVTSTSRARSVISTTRALLQLADEVFSAETAKLLPDSLDLAFAPPILDHCLFDVSPGFEIIAP